MQNYRIVDINLFVESCRVMVYHHFGSDNDPPEKGGLDKMLLTFDDLMDEEKEEIDTCLSQSESLLIFKEYAKTKKDKISKVKKYYISEKSFFEYIDALNARMVGNILKNLASKGMIETAFDDEANDFVFWIKNNDEQQPEKEEKENN